MSEMETKTKYIQLTLEQELEGLNPIYVRFFYSTAL